MFKFFTLMRRKEGLSAARFRAHWREVHGPLAVRLGMDRYVQSARIADVAWANAGAFDGVAESWRPQREGAVHVAGTPEYRAIVEDEAHFLDPAGRLVLPTREHVIQAGPTIHRDTRCLKGLFFLKKRADLTVAEFQRIWLDGHARLVPRSPGLLRYVQCHVLEEAYDSATPPSYDGVTELWWSDRDDYERFSASDELRVEQARDAASFSSGGGFAFLAEEARFVWP